MRVLLLQRTTFNTLNTESACVPAALGAAAAGAGTFPGWWLLHIVYTSPVLFLVGKRLEVLLLTASLRRRLGLSVSGPLEQSGSLRKRGGEGSCPQWKPCGQPFQLSGVLASHSSLLSGIIFLTPCPSWAPELTNRKPSCGQQFPLF